MFSVRGELRDAPWLWQKKVASIEVLGKPPWLKTATRAWRPVILSSDRFRRRFAAWLAGFFLKLALGAGPVLERISGRATALQIDMVGAQCDLLGCRTEPACSRHPRCWRGTLPRLGHTLLPSTAAFILHLVESHRFRIHWRPNRKIQYIQSKKRGPSARETNSRSASLEEGLKNAPPPTKSTVGGDCAGPDLNFLWTVVNNAGSWTRDEAAAR